MYGLNGTGQGRGLLKWDYDGEKWSTIMQGLPFCYHWID